jgi:cytochrome c5
MWRISTIALLAALAAALASAGCGGKEKAAAAEPAGEQTSLAAEPYEPEAETPAKAATEAAGKTLLEARCTVCHDLERVHKKKDDTEGWAKTVDRMRAKGARLDDAERAAVVSYLAENFGK